MAICYACSRAAPGSCPRPHDQPQRMPTSSLLQPVPFPASSRPRYCLSPGPNPTGFGLAPAPAPTCAGPVYISL
ncbi:hypothetical protein E2C01_081639 [Portunus trituberculatus]|uniref:Uncharacterized protein n=1 Tax=Portunus trituberculatus TaxID=210409 RepID=A0A5B7IX21_PORTR|nr:hypothetical protein [Portunus trituberculatus]